MGVKTIVLVEDHHVVRQALRALLEAEPDLSIVGEAADGLEAVQLVESLEPDVVVLDLRLQADAQAEPTKSSGTDPICPTTWHTAFGGRILR